MLLHYNHLKGRMSKIRTVEQEKLVQLTIISNDALKQLKEKNRKVC